MSGMKKMLLGMMAASMIAVGGMATQTVQAKDSGGYRNMYRLYQPANYEHFYTASTNERDVLTSQHGWKYEGIAWVAPKRSNTPVYRLYNPILRDHHYTTSKYERDVLVAKHGWNDEGIGWYSSDTKLVPIYRAYNPGLTSGSHNYTKDANEQRILTTQRGWKAEGTAWYGYKKTTASSPNVPSTTIRVDDIEFESPEVLTVGINKKAVVEVEPSYATNKGYTITSSNTSILAVSGTTLIPKKAGRVTLTVKSKDGGDVDRETVTVKAKSSSSSGTTAIKITDIEFEGPEVLTVGTNKKAVVELKPSNATNKGYTITSSNTSILAVSGTTLIPKKAGRVTLTVKSKDGGDVDRETVTVKAKSTSSSTSTSSTSFTKIIVKAQYKDVDIEYGTRGVTNGGGTISNGILTITDNSKPSHDDDDIKIVLNKTGLSSVSVTTTSGDIDIEGLNITKLIASSSRGDVSLDRVNVGNTSKGSSIKTTYGEVDLEGTTLISDYRNGYLTSSPKPELD
jgi:hypothetical protein